MAEERDDDDIFVYTGGNQVVPQNVKRVRIGRHNSKLFHFGRSQVVST